jgi:hypothetical protein
MSLSDEKSGLVYIVVRVEPQARPAIPVAKITRVLDLRAPKREVVNRAGVDAICDAVREWLVDFLAQHVHD